MDSDKSKPAVKSAVKETKSLKHEDKSLLKPDICQCKGKISHEAKSYKICCPVENGLDENGKKSDAAFVKQTINEEKLTDNSVRENKPAEYGGRKQTARDGEKADNGSGSSSNRSSRSSSSTAVVAIVKLAVVVVAVVAAATAAAVERQGERGEKAT
ncbi:hypothetical protein ElyMa_005399200 [Elysia marginata]|uniref:Uncharacterized protein n=1 Tax=Elysia marginata TaxID=1093978 RepID=A0AAV4EH85_9GAST|nr:hypothetical protein ElyMa_005399200 [Elysia marginata]